MRSLIASAVVVGAVLMAVGGAVADPGTAKREDCGKYSSASIYPKALIAKGVGQAGTY